MNLFWYKIYNFAKLKEYLESIDVIIEEFDEIYDEIKQHVYKVIWS